MYFSKVRTMFVTVNRKSNLRTVGTLIHGNGIGQDWNVPNEHN